jgi:hypothetical protein
LSFRQVDRRELVGLVMIFYEGNVMCLTATRCKFEQRTARNSTKLTVLFQTRPESYVACLVRDLTPVRGIATSLS